jgi:hypothetical protein
VLLKIYISSDMHAVYIPVHVSLAVIFLTCYVVVHGHAIWSY